MEFSQLENFYENKSKISSTDFVRERTISSMDCNEYKEKICPQTPRIKPQKSPNIQILELNLPPIIEEANEEQINFQRTCYFSHNEQLPQFELDETSTENDSLSAVSCSQSMVNLAGKTEFMESQIYDSPNLVKKQESALKKCKSMKLGKQKRNRAGSVVLPRFSIFSFLKKIIRKSKHNNNGF